MTHINAFYADVGDKKQKVAEAQGELDRAERVLKAHPDYVAPKKKVTLKEETPKAKKRVTKKK